MLITLLLSQGGKFTLDIGDEEMTAADCVQATHEILDSGETVHGAWGGVREHDMAIGQDPFGNTRPFVAARINPLYVAAITEAKEKS